MDNTDVQKQFDDYFDLFSRPGWALFMEDIDGMIEAMDSLEYVTSMEDLHDKKGQLKILKRMAGFRATMEAAYEDFTSEEG